MRKYFSYEFKAKVAIEALKDEKTVSKINSEYRVHATQIEQWKDLAQVGLPELQPGEILVIMNAGAYFTFHSTNFSFPRPAIVIVSDGKSKIIRNQETFEHLTTLDRDWKYSG